MTPQLMMEKLHFYGLQGMYFSKCLTSEGGILLTSNTVEDVYYNYYASLQMRGIPFEEVWKRVISMFPKNRKPAIYVTPSSELYGNEIILKGFKREYTDAWMVMQNSDILENYRYDNNIEIHEVIDREEFENDFTSTFQLAYSSDDPEDAYGQLSPTYREALLKSWNANREYAVKHFIARYCGTPVGVATAITDEGITGVYNLGTVHSYRHKGVGKSLMSAIVNDADTKQIVFLQTEMDSITEQWYKSMGFQSIFYGECFTESE